MHCIKVHKIIALMISLYYFIGFWHRGDKPTARELTMKLFYCIYYSLFFVSFVVGAISTEKGEQIIFLSEVSVGVGINAMKLWILIWKQNQILKLLHRICEFSIRDDYGYVLFSNKIGRFIRFMKGFLIYIIIGDALISVILPLLGSEKTLFFEIGFPLDWRSSEVAFWIATIFISTEVLLTLFSTIFSTLIWYLLLNCSLRYEVLGSELKHMGQITDNENRKTSKNQLSHHHFFKRLQESIDAHVHLTGWTNELGSFFSLLFFIQFGTSGLCICGSIYCLAFDISDSLLERYTTYVFVFFYYIAELFMITYFGNEIMLSSSRLSYSLFESDWCNQPQSTKKCIIIFGEYLKQPQELVIGKMYPLNLETFTRIFNSAYSMFNILKNFER